ncbi:MAG: archaemetzincin [Planctomycetota bacterium]
MQPSLRVRSLTAVVPACFALFLCLAQPTAQAQAKAFMPASLPEFVPIVEPGAPEDVRLPLPRRGEWLDAYRETDMTFLEYVSSDPLRASPARRTIYLAPMGGIADARSLEELKNFLSAFFCLPVRILEGGSPPREAYCAQRGQYDGDEVLLSLSRSLPPDALLAAALMDADLYSGRLSAVFGLAYRDLRSCVISTARLWTDPRAARSAQERVRFFKLVAHEICHVFGLAHSAAYEDLMNGTLSFNDLDRSPLLLSAPSLRKLRYSVGFDTLDRYERLDAFWQDFHYPQCAQALSPRLCRLRAQAARPRPLLPVELAVTRKKW